jgi:hypothetical protein
LDACRSPESTLEQVKVRNSIDAASSTPGTLTIVARIGITTGDVKGMSDPVTEVGPSGSLSTAKAMKNPIMSGMIKGNCIC